MFKGKITKVTAVAMSFLFFSSAAFSFKAEGSLTSAPKPAAEVDYSKLTTDASTLRYVDYLSQHSETGFNGDEITIMGADYTNGQNVAKVNGYEGKNVATTDEIGFISYTVDIKTAGLYAIEVEYFPMPGTGGEIERTVIINGEIPFQEAFGVELTRIYADEQLNPSGNESRPTQVEAPRWNTDTLADAFGYFGGAVYFYFEKGVQTLTLNSIKEPMAISQIKLISVDLTPKSYQEQLAEWKAMGAAEVNGVMEKGMTIFNAEDTYEKGDPTLYAINDNTSTKTFPHAYDTKLMNAIGGEPWKYSNQWISWKITVPKDGFYNIGFRAKQNFTRDVASNRSLYIDDVVPFEEAYNIHFEYSDKWYTMMAGEDEPYMFYLTAGEHTIKLKVTAGDLVDVLTEADYVLTNLNKINLELLSFLTAKPDKDRDYKLGERMPEVIERIRENSERLKAVYIEMLERNGGKNDSLTARLQTLISILDKMANKPDNIPKLFKQFRDNIGAFGTWIMDVREHRLMLDSVIVSEVGTKVKIKEDNFFDKLVATIIGFISSFTNDYSMISVEGSGDRVITVWIGSGATGGRDQALALNQMVIKDFTDKTGIAVNLQLVSAGTILVATLAGRGPDVALQVGVSDPVDFALRNAVADLTQFADFEEVSKRFFDGTMLPFEFNGGYYALPETASFPMLFYRTDVMRDLGITTDDLLTWENIIEINPILQAENMSFALPSDTMTSFNMFLYQRGGDLYTEGNTASALNSKVSLEAFKYWTDFYLEHGMSIDFSFENRFRTGEMPIGIADYTMYNTLSISAPEIKGKWAMTTVPGTILEDGTISNVAPVSAQGCIMLEASKNKADAWEFMKWWTSAEAQYEFGRQLESIMGAAARYNTANIEAFQLLPWTAIDRQNLMTQASNLKGIPQVPGGYFTERNFKFAKLDVLNTKVSKRTDARETLSSYTININNEITQKRKEFDLTTE